MLGGYTRTKTNSVLRDSRVIYRRNPEAAPPKFMPQPIHASAITNDDRHHISRRRSGVEAEALKLRVKVIGIFPKLHTQLRLTCADLEGLQNGRNHHRRQRTGVNIGMRVETQ